MAKQTPKFIFLIFGFLIWLNILAWIAVYELSQPRFLEINFFDIGQGDAIFIETPQRHQILIDGGPDSAILEKLAAEMPFWDRTIDLIILTHPESDHLTGLIEVLKKYQVDFILWTGAIRDTFEWEEWQKLIESQKERGVKLLIAQAGQRIKWTGFDPVHLYDVIEILFPLENLEGHLFKDSNNTSIVAKLIYGENSFLFTGDIYESEEREILERGFDINSDVLKVAHHGSKTSSSNEFIERVWPKIAVIQVGKDNRYGHPHQKVLEILTKYDITLLRTDRDGDIKIISDGKNFKIAN